MAGSRWLPFPGMSLLLWAVWLLLVNKITVDHVLLGAFLGWLIPRVTSLFWPAVPRLRRFSRLRFSNRNSPSSKCSPEDWSVLCRDDLGCPIIRLFVPNIGLKPDLMECAYDIRCRDAPPL